MIWPARHRRGPIGVSLLAALATPEEIERAITEELSQPKYRVAEPWWTGVVDALSRAWVRFIEWALGVSEYVGGPLVMGALVGATILGAAAVVTANLGKRRARVVADRIRREHQAVRGWDPDELERRASEAESAEDFLTAFRLLFQSALIRLDAAGIIDLSPSATSAGLAEALHSPAFDRVVNRFDAVVYGGRDATPEDLELVRGVLPALLGVSR